MYTELVIAISKPISEMPYPTDILYYSHLLTHRESEVLKLLSFGHSSGEIANRLNVSIHTIISHRKNMMDKLDLNNSAGLVRRSFEIGELQQFSEIYL